MTIDRLSQEELQLLLKQRNDYYLILSKFLELELATEEVSK